MLDFSNRTFDQFFMDHFELNIYADAFSKYGTSKFNRLRAFVEIAPPHLVVELLNILWRRKHKDRDDHIEEIYRRLESDAWAIDTDYVSAVQSAADNQDSDFRKLIEELGSLPSHAATPLLKRVSAEWTLDTVDLETTRALENIEKDPEASITAACSMVESVCRSILTSRSLPLPKTMDIQTLYKVVREPLGLSPKKDLHDTEIEADVRTILSAISNAVQGIGALRSHAGTAHGREKGFRRLDPRIARLSVNCALSLTLFLIETWEKKFPDDKLRKL